MDNPTPGQTFTAAVFLRMLILTIPGCLLRDRMMAMGLFPVGWSGFLEAVPWGLGALALGTALQKKERSRSRALTGLLVLGTALSLVLGYYLITLPRARDLHRWVEREGLLQRRSEELRAREAGAEGNGAMSVSRAYFDRMAREGASHRGQ